MQIKNIEKLILPQFIEHIPQFVWWKDLNSVFIGCNENTAKYLGLNNAKEIIGLSDYDIYKNKEDADFVSKTDQKIIRTGKSQLNFEEYLTLPNLGKRWLSTSKIPLRDDDNNIIGTLGWFNDITEVKELKIELNEKNKILFEYNLELKKALRDLEIVNIDLERFTYAASHDLKRPLKEVKNFTQLLSKNENNDLSEKSTQHIDSIFKSIDSMESFIDDILDYAMSGSKNLIAEYVNINEILALKVMNLKFSNKTREIINYNLPKTKIKVYKNLIGLLFFNLINNAIKFNDSKTPTINIDFNKEKDFWHFTVEDNGIGIEQKYIKEIFKPFTKITPNKGKGSGIGLSICKRVVALHNGEIWVEKNQKGNTVFKFSISRHL